MREENKILKEKMQQLVNLNTIYETKIKKNNM